LGSAVWYPPTVQINEVDGLEKVYHGTAEAHRASMEGGGFQLPLYVSRERMVALVYAVAEAAVTDTKPIVVELVVPISHMERDPESLGDDSSVRMLVEAPPNGGVVGFCSVDEDDALLSHPVFTRKVKVLIAFKRMARATPSAARQEVRRRARAKKRKPMANHQILRKQLMLNLIKGPPQQAAERHELRRVFRGDQ
jgi:hypothetical protein